jgi:integrase/recombinase XerD
MKQAKTLDERELRRVLDHVATRSHAARNRAMIMMTFFGGFRVGEVAQLRLEDVFDSEGKVKPEVRLDGERVKNKHARTVFLPERLRRELIAYHETLKVLDPTIPLFPTQKSPKRGFTPNTAAQHFAAIYRSAGLDGATSHSGRRTFITRLANKGVSVRVLASLAGHKSITTTQRYIDVNDDMKRAAVELI